jgi:phosphotransferase system HPr-like phosphotransfer protein
MGAILVTRTESQLSLTSSFKALDNLGGASVSSSFTVASGMGAIKQVAIAVTADGAEETVPIVKISGNAMRDGDAVMTGAAIVNAGSATGTASNFCVYDTDLAVQPGNSCEISIAGTDDATVSAAVTLTFA